MVEILKALSEESRLRILSVLLDGEMCVCEIESTLNMTQSNASRHLNLLKQNGILICYKKAQWTYYQISEKFRLEQKELFDYLSVRLRALPSYQMDIQNKRSCMDKDICTYNINPH